MAENEEDRTEQATPRRREKAREKGQIARSRELVSMASTAGILLVFYMAGAAFMKNATGLTGRLLGLGYGKDPLTVMRAATVDTMMLLAPFFLSVVVFAILSNVAQGGVLFKPLALEFNRVNPATGFKNIFSLTALPGLIKTLIKFVVGIVLFYLVTKQALVILPATSAMDLPDIQRTAFGVTGKAVAWAFGVYFTLAAIDYLYEWWRFERSIRMTKEEIRQEHRESEGDPHIKARIKGLQREAARRRMMAAVPKATVVITNPTHIAVALIYDKNQAAAPKVVAKGKGVIAQNIRDLARQHSVPIVEDKPLARALFKVKLDAFIPAELYRAVAKILAYIYKMKGRAA